MSVLVRSAPLVSIITPSYQRHDWLVRLHGAIQCQTLTDWEWLVFDDSPAPCIQIQALAGNCDNNIRYIHAESRFTIGEKRNVMAGMARGALIAHFDDDDYYAPDYLARMVAALEGHCDQTEIQTASSIPFADGQDRAAGQGADFVTLSGWFLYHAASGALGYWDCTRHGGWHDGWSRRGIEPVHIDPAGSSRDQVIRANRLGFGFSYLYRREVWQAQPFPPVNGGEDLPFAEAACQRFRVRTLADTQGLVVHILHGSNASRCLPQYRLPPFLVGRLFGPAAASYLGAGVER